jgi:hypothetical protein
MEDQSSYITDLNKVYIPSRPIIEMELLLSKILYNNSYNNLRDKFLGIHTQKEFMRNFQIQEEIQIEIVERFFIVIDKVKSISMNMRSTKSSSDFGRIGNVDAYTKSRIPIFFGLDHLKFRFLVIDQYMKKLFTLQKKILEMLSAQQIHLSLDDFYDYYFLRMHDYFHLISPSKNIAEHTKEVYHERMSGDLIEILSTKDLPTEISKMDELMRGIKSSLLVCLFMFKKIDVNEPFMISDVHISNSEEIMLSQEFVPILIPEIIYGFNNQNANSLGDLFQAYSFFMNRTIQGINKAVEIASNGKIHLAREKLNYKLLDIL